MRRFRPDEYKHDDVRPLVARAFAALRKTGLVCRMNFSCCMGCACSELEPIVKERKARGAVYFHRQDDKSFRAGRDLEVRYGPMEDGDVAWTALGEEVRQALVDQGLVVEWDGDPDNTVTVKTSESSAALREAKVG
jgi:hypothetical protein